MVEKISKTILKKISNKNDSPEEKEIMLFGITRIVEDIPKYIGIIIICSVLSVLNELAIVFSVTAIYKTFVGGVHMKTNIGCFLWSLGYFLICIYIPKYVEFSVTTYYYIYLLTYIFGIYVILTYVPADVPEIPIINENRRKRDKIVSFILLNLIYVVIMFAIKNIIYSNMICLTIFLINILTTRTVYKLLKNEYGYETYVPDELLIMN